MTKTMPAVPFAEAVARYDPVIGLETHVELGTVTKMFCGCPAGFGAEPNAAVCPVCLGLPGSLPVANRAAIESTIRIGLALNCSIASWCRFARKNYFYPDMPKDFQISQYDEPLCTDGWLDITVDGADFRIGIERVHLEEDTGKSLHVGGATGRIHGANYSLVDYNRAGHPAGGGRHQAGARHRRARPGGGPRLRHRAARDAAGARGVRRADGGGLAALRRQHLAGAARRRPSGAPAPRPRTSTRCARSSGPSARRSSGRPAVLDAGGRVVQETRHFHEDSGLTTPGRSKEEAQDYRYFPEPDLVPVAPSPELGRAAAGRAARAAVGPPGPAAGRVGAIRPGHDRARQRGRARPGG